MANHPPDSPSDSMVQELTSQLSSIPLQLIQWVPHIWRALIVLLPG